MLEMFSGKQPSGCILNDAYNLHEYVRKAIPHQVFDIADPRVTREHKDHGSTANQSSDRVRMEVCLTSIFQVGILCSVEKPKVCIDISFALKQLLGAIDLLLSPCSQQI